VSETYSVIIPAYNAASTLDSCLASVVAQSLAPLQVLIIDDDSEDDTESVARRYQERFAEAGIQFEYHRLLKNRGPSAARNRGIREAKGTYIAFLDSDDVWAKEKLEVVDQFASGSGADLICHSYTVAQSFRPYAGAVRYDGESISKYRMLLRNPGQPSCVVARNRPNIAFNEAMSYCEDYDLWVKIAEKSEVLRLVGEPLACLGRPQLSPGGLSGNTFRMRLGEMRVYYNFCRRAWLNRAWLLPVLLLYSLSKHVYSALRRRLR
jgi:glycosyltransferase involved in cell wall biosynthesis